MSRQAAVTNLAHPLSESRDPAGGAPTRGKVNSGGRPPAVDPGHGTRASEREEASTSAVRRAVDLLTLVAEAQDSLAVRDVADALALAPSTSHRLLRQLVDAGFVTASPATHRYEVGPALYRLGALVRARTDLATVVQPFLEELTAECDETSLFAVFHPSTVTTTFVAKADSSHALSYRIELNVPVSPYWGSSSEVILAYLAQADLQRVLDKVGPSPVGGFEPLSEDKFRAKMATIRRRGYTVTRGLKLVGAVGTSAAVFEAERVLGSVTVTIPQVRFRRTMGPRIQDLVTETAQRVSRVLGHREGAGPPAER
ncbi:MAG: IclR family transcriptional regulator [Solirubrobacteraceae bacterium]